MCLLKQKMEQSSCKYHARSNFIHPVLGHPYKDLLGSTRVGRPIACQTAGQGGGYSRICFLFRRELGLGVSHPHHCHERQVDERAYTLTHTLTLARILKSMQTQSRTLAITLKPFSQKIWTWPARRRPCTASRRSHTPRQTRE